MPTRGSHSCWEARSIRLNPSKLSSSIVGTFHNNIALSGRLARGSSYLQSKQQARCARSTSISTPTRILVDIALLCRLASVSFRLPHLEPPPYVDCGPAPWLDLALCCFSFLSCDFSPCNNLSLLFLSPQIPSPWLLQTRKCQIDLLTLICTGRVKMGRKPSRQLILLRSKGQYENIASSFGYFCELSPANRTTIGILQDNNRCTNLADICPALGRQPSILDRQALSTAWPCLAIVVIFHKIRSA